MGEFYNVDISTNNNNSLTYNSCFFYAIYFSYDSFFVDYRFFYRKENSYGSCVSSFFTYSIYLYATCEDKSLIADNKVETVKAQRETVEREKEMERRRIQEEVDKERYIEKHGMEISENDLKVKLEALVPQEYKGKKYELKVGKFKRYSMYFDLTVQNEKFSNSEECKKFVKEIANDLKKLK